MNRILVLEGRKPSPSALGDILEFNGYSVFKAENPENVVSLIQGQTYSLLIAEYAVGDGAGMDVIPMVRATPNGAQLKILLLTFKELDETELGHLLCHDVLYLRKPFLPNVLVRKIETLLS